jgi:hypothetical protein
MKGDFKIHFSLEAPKVLFIAENPTYKPFHCRMLFFCFDKSTL